MDIYLKDYLYCGDTSLAISEALRECQEGDTLHLGGGVLEFARTYATPVNYYLPRYSDQTKYYAIYLENRKNITIDGDGASLIFKGDVSGFGFDGCEGLTLKNFSMDYKYPYFWQAMITEANDEYFEVEFDEKNFPCKYDPEKKMLGFGSGKDGFFWEDGAILADEFKPVEKKVVNDSPDYFLCMGLPHPVYPFMSVMVETEIVASDRFRFHFKERSVKHTAGNYLVVSNHERRNNNIHLHKCKDIVLENINMYSSPSFGVISLLCQNLTVRNVNSILRADSGRMLAVQADMFHCVNCRGMIDIGQCTIENQMDDGVNIHSLMCEVEKLLDDHTIIVKIPYRAERAINLFSKGEKIHCLKKKTYERGKEFTVCSSEFAGQYHLRIELEEKLKKDLIGYLLESTDAMPQIHLHDCRSGNNRGRGFLVSSSNRTIVENNVFYNSEPGIFVGGASEFYAEGGAVTDLTIRDNCFDGCAYRGGDAIVINPRSITEERKSAYHRNIRIENNKFRMEGDNLMSIRLADNVQTENNAHLRR